jgi:hypothetical protein
LKPAQDRSAPALTLQLKWSHLAIADINSSVPA